MSSNDILPEGQSEDLHELEQPEVALPATKLDETSGWARTIDLADYKALALSFHNYQDISDSLSAGDAVYTDEYLSEATGELLSNIEKVQGGGLGKVDENNIGEFVEALENLYGHRVGKDPLAQGTRIEVPTDMLKAYNEKHEQGLDKEAPKLQGSTQIFETVSLTLSEIYQKENPSFDLTSMVNDYGVDGQELESDEFLNEPSLTQSEEGALFNIDATLTAVMTLRSPDSVLKTDSPIIACSITTKVIESQKPEASFMESVIDGVAPEWEKYNAGELQTKDVSNLLSDLGLRVAPLLHASQNIVRRALSEDKNIFTKTHGDQFASDMKDFVREQLNENKALLMFVLAKDMAREFSERWAEKRGFTETLQDDCLGHMKDYIEKAHPIVNRVLDGLIKAIS